MPQITMKQISIPVATEWSNRHHSILKIRHPSAIWRSPPCPCYAAIMNSDIVAVAIYSAPVERKMHSRHRLELRRLTITNSAPKNTGSHFFSMTTRHIREHYPDISEIISYQSTHHHYGSLYKACNFTRDGETRFCTWNHDNRKRNSDQIQSPKVRWKYQLRRVRNCPHSRKLDASAFTLEPPPF